MYCCKHQTNCLVYHGGNACHCYDTLRCTCNDKLDHSTNLLDNLILGDIQPGIVYTQDLKSDYRKEILSIVLKCIEESKSPYVAATTKSKGLFGREETQKSRLVDYDLLIQALKREIGE